MKTLYQTKLNKLILLVHGITTFFLTMGLMAQLMSSGLPPMKSVPQIVLNLLVFIGGIIMFIKFKSTILYTRYVGIAFSAVYFFILVTAFSGVTYAYMMPIFSFWYYPLINLYCLFPAESFLLPISCVSYLRQPGTIWRTIQSSSPLW